MLGILKGLLALLETHSDRIDAQHVLRPVGDGEEDFLLEYSQLVEFLWQVQQILVEVEVEVVAVRLHLDVEYVLLLLSDSIYVPNVVLPVCEVHGLSSGQSLSEVVANLLELLALRQLLPVSSEHGLDSLHVDI